MSTEQQPGQPIPAQEGVRDIDPAYAEMKKKRKKPGYELPGGGLAITSLMDALTIILTFLLSSYANEPMSIQQNDKLKVAFSITKNNLQGAAKVEIQADAIYCNQKRSALLREENGIRTVDEKAKAGGKQSYLIEDLKGQLEDYKKQLEEIEKRGGRKYQTKTWMLLAVDIATPIRIVKEVLYTAKEAGYDRYMFAVIRNATAD